MAKAKFNFKAKAKKALAILSSAALVLSCGTTGLFSADAAEIDGIFASEAAGEPSEIYLYDENGNDITANPIVYVDNSSAAGGNTDIGVTAKVKDAEGNLVATTINVYVDPQPKGKPIITWNGSSSVYANQSSIRIFGAYYDSILKQDVSNYPGTTQVHFAADNGNLYRNLTVVTYEPATDVKLFWGNKNTQLSINDYVADNSTRVQAIANHQYPIYYEFVKKTSTDVMEYSVYEGDYYGVGNGQPTDKAEISQDGIFTPKKNGFVTIVCKPKATETSDRTYSAGTKKVYEYDEKKGKIVEVEKTIQTLPKYINVTIVKENPAKSLNFTNGISAMEADDTYQLEYKAEPTYSKDQGYETGATDVLRWESSNPEIATVDQKGLVTALSKGDVKITAYAENETVYAECDIRVLTKATSIKLPGTFSTRIGVTSQISATMNPATADDEIVWTSSDDSVAVVEPVPGTTFSNVQTANVTGMKKGTAILTATAKNSGVEARITVNVNDKIATDNLTFSINRNGTLSPIPEETAVEVYTTQDCNIDGRLTDSNGQLSDDKIVWTVDNNEDNKYAVVTINLNSVNVKGVAPGRIKITAASDANANIKKSFYVDVLKSSETITVYNSKNGEKIDSSKPLQVNNKLSLYAVPSVSGNNPEHDDKIISWSSSDESVASVDNNGIVTAHKNGSASITVTAASGRTKSVTVLVFSTSQVNINSAKAPAESGMLPTLTMNLKPNLTGTSVLATTVKDQDNKTVTNVDLTWTSSNEDVAVVTDNGTVTALDVGTTVLKVKSGPQEQNCLLTVTAPLTTDKLTYVNETNEFTKAIEPYYYSPGAEAYEPHPIVAVGNNTLKEGVDYTISYVDNTAVNKSTTKVVITGMGLYTGQTSVNFKIYPRPITDESVVLSSIDKQECTGSAITPELNLMCYGTVLQKDIDYKVTYSNNIRPGDANVTITGMGNYSDILKSTFEIFCEHKNLKDVKVLTPASYDNTGLEEGTCTACGQKGVQRITNSLNHSANPAASLTLDKTEAGMGIGDTITLVPTGIGRNNPSEPITDKFRWESGDTKIATVDDNGNVKGIKKGTVMITVFGEFDDVYAECLVTVLGNKVKIIDLTPNPAATRVTVATEIKAIINPEKTDDEIIWEVEDPSIAEISSSSTDSIIVVGKAVGTTKVIATAKYSNISAETTLTVAERNESDLISISANIFGEESVLPVSDSNYVQDIYTNQDITFTAQLKDDNGNISDDTVVWKLSENEDNHITLAQGLNPENEFESSSFTVHGAIIGKAKLTAYAKNNPSVKVTFTLNVIRSCVNVAIQNTSGERLSNKFIDSKDGIQLEALLTTNDPTNPEDHSDRVVSWVSSNPEILEVSSTGYAKAITQGKAVVTVTTASHKSTTATFNVFVTSNVFLTKASLDKDVEPKTSTLTLKATKYEDQTIFTGTKKLSVTVYNDQDSPVSGVSCKWSSSNPEVATVDEKGLVSGHTVGETVITVRSGSCVDECIVVVSLPITNFTYAAVPDVSYSPSVTAYEPPLPMISIMYGFLVDGVGIAESYIELVPGQDFTYEYTNNTKIGTGYIVITGSSQYPGTSKIPFKIVQKDISEADVKISNIPEQDYTGSDIKPTVTIRYDGATLVEGTDYTLSYSNNKNPSTEKTPATLKITGKGNYKGTVNKDFNIVKRVTGIYGDVDGTSVIDSADALLILRRSVSLEQFDETQEALADVDNDGSITSSDSLFVLRKSVGFDDGTKAGKEL